MKRLILLILIAAALGVGTYFLCRNRMDHSACGLPMDKRSEMQWLRSEFKLTDAQYSRIVALHEQYQPVCDEMCAKIAAKNGEVARLIRDNGQVTPEVAAALAEAAALNASCRQALLGHVYAVSREMSPEQGRRYVEMMTPTITGMGSGSVRQHDEAHP